MSKIFLTEESGRLLGTSKIFRERLILLALGMVYYVHAFYFCNQVLLRLTVIFTIRNCDNFNVNQLLLCAKNVARLAIAGCKYLVLKCLVFVSDSYCGLCKNLSMVNEVNLSQKLVGLQHLPHQHYDLESDYIQH